jgi:DNA invertase Pin-like site-specific DNA recombinase
MNENKITALYERLSKGDKERSEESLSIQNQKLLLEQHAKNHGFRNIAHYTDDDESGRFFDRPGYVQMMDDVESGKIGVILLKDENCKQRIKILCRNFCEAPARSCAY